MRWVLAVLILGTGIATAMWDSLKTWQRYVLTLVWGVTAVLVLREFRVED
jgi:hypothetical protein